MARITQIKEAFLFSLPYPRYPRDLRFNCARYLRYTYPMSKIALAIHGGAGTILRSSMTPELEREYRDGLENALGAGWKILSDGGTALDCVEATVCRLEDFPLFNAGRGSVFTHDGKNEMDASI